MVFPNMVLDVIDLLFNEGSAFGEYKLMYVVYYIRNWSVRIDVVT